MPITIDIKQDYLYNKGREEGREEGVEEYFKFTVLRLYSLEPIQNSINWLWMAHFASSRVGFFDCVELTFRRSCWLRLQNPPWLKQNGLILAQSWKFE